MTKLMGKIFRGLFEFWLWFSLILWAIMGGIGGYAMGGFYRNDYVIPCVIAGLILGFLVNALCGGLIAKFLIMCDNIQKLADRKASE